MREALPLVSFLLYYLFLIRCEDIGVHDVIFSMNDFSYEVKNSLVAFTFNKRQRQKE